MSIDLRARPQMLWWFALFVGASYFIADKMALQGPDMVAWKGFGVGLLALWAARHADDVQGWAIATILAAGATGDVLIETHGLVAGALAFLIGHLLAIALYARGAWRRGWPLVVCVAVGVSVVGYALTGAAGVAVYAAALGGMAGAASLGRFGRWPMAGAWLFVVSDVLLFARMDVLAGSVIPSLLIWPTYFAGQALIAWGVVSTLVAEQHG
ncbi:lysoplasmalogenase family protein [Sphingomonas floccifaciens]|uniref:Lysoplasmalogenase family protein n=1 Tax=Sphingomonas floccifaciens TaxID=1844115 RepID=A0ABW4NAQ3_9SPHN